MRRSLFVVFVVALLSFAFLSGCATSPTGRTQLLLVSPEAAIVHSAPAYLSMVAQLSEEHGLLNDPVLADRIAVITGRLVAVAEQQYPHTATWDWSVALIDDPETVNAWCMAGGRMGLHSGLIAQLDPTDDELAQVMGHELSHAIANHTAEQMSLAIAKTLGVVAIAIASEDDDTATAASTAAELAIALPNSRAAETEADRIGIELAARAGYAPGAAATLWEKMTGLADGNRPPEFLSTHPSPYRRQEELADLAQAMLPLLAKTPPIAREVRILSALSTLSTLSTTSVHSPEPSPQTW